MSLATYQQLVDDLVRDKDQVVSSTSRDSAIANAVAAYSVDAPRTLVRDVTGDGSAVFTLPTEWADGISDLLSIEYPIGNLPTSLIDGQYYGLYLTPTGAQLRIDSSIGIGSGDSARVTFTAGHQLDGTNDTIPLKHQRAVAALAAAEVCGQLASYYASEGMPTIGADVSDHQGKTDRYRARQRDLLALYQSVVGSAPSERTKPASAVAQPQPALDSLGRPRIFHPVRNWPVTP